MHVPPTAFFQQLEMQISMCDHFNWKNGFDGAYADMRNSNMVIIYASTASLIMCVLYYVLRPADNDALKLWWTHGGFIAFIIIFGSSTITIIALLVLSSDIFAMYAVPWTPNDMSFFCQIKNRYGVLLSIRADIPRNKQSSFRPPHVKCCCWILAVSSVARLIRLSCS